MTSLHADQLTSSTTKIDRIKYFPLELYCANLMPNTIYDAYYEGVNVNAFCKGYGKNLGEDLKSDMAGKLVILFLMGMSYKQQYLVTQTPKNNLVTVSKAFELKTQNGGVSSITYIPMTLQTN